MRCRLPFALPFVLALGCAAPSPASPEQPAASAVPSTASTEAPIAGAAPVAVAPAAPAAAAKGADKSPTPNKAAAASDAPIVTKITQDEILALVNKNMDTFNRCYTLGAGSSKSYRAKVTVKATVSPTGTVTVVEVLDSTAKNPKVDACVSDGFKKLTFARPNGSGATVFTFPLSFDGIVQTQ